MKINILKKAVAVSLVAFTGFAFAQDSWGDTDTDTTGSSSSSPVTVGVDASLGIRGYVNKEAVKVESFDDLKNFPVNADLKGKLTVGYSNDKFDADIKLNFTEDTVTAHKEDIIDELTMRGYFGNFLLEAGKMRVVWGKGDKLHVLDNFNADDYSDFIIPDYLDRRISTPMVRASYNFGVGNLQLEGVYTPFLPVDRFKTSGFWTPAAVTSLTSAVTAIETNKLGSAFTAYTQATVLASEVQTLASEAQAGNTNASTVLGALCAQYHCANVAQLGALVQANLTNAGTAYLTTLAEVNSMSAEKLYPETNKLEYGQAGLRLTGTVGSFDYGVSYYYGHYKQPTANWNAFMMTGGKALPTLAYDQKQTFGLEAATVLWHFNLRGEAAYNLTKDVEGDDPFVHNNSVQWLFGFDIDLPINNLNVNVQETGTYIIKNNKIRDMPEAIRALNADYNANNYYTNNKVVVNISDSWLNDKIVPEVSILWGIENVDLVIMPKLSFKPNPNFTLYASGMYIWCKTNTSEFAAWKDNSFVELGAKCIF